MVTREDRPRSSSALGRVWLWVRRILVMLFGLILLVLLVGLVYQFVATRLAYRNYPAPGEMFSVSGHDMHIYCTGKSRGAPTVVMDSGLGGGLLDWQTVQPKVAEPHGCALTTAPASGGASRGKAAHEPADREGTARPA